MIEGFACVCGAWMWRRSLVGRMVVRALCRWHRSHGTMYVRADSQAEAVRLMEATSDHLRLWFP